MPLHPLERETIRRLANMRLIFSPYLYDSEESDSTEDVYEDDDDSDYYYDW